MIDVKNCQFEIRCQKCSTLVAVPLSYLRGPVSGTIEVPEHLICETCGRYMTTRIMAVEKKKEKKKS